MSLSFYARDSQIVILELGSHKTHIGQADYTKLPALTVLNEHSLDLHLIKLFQKYEINIPKNDFPVVLITKNQTKRELEDLIQILFEKLNIPGLFLLDSALACLYGCGLVTGLVVDLGTTVTITPVFDNHVITTAKVVLKHNIRNAKTIEDCAELWDPKDEMSVQDGIIWAVTTAVEGPKRLSLWESIVVTGGLSKIAGIETKLEQELLKKIQISETSNEYQPKEIKYQYCQEYMLSFKDRPHLLSYLGGTIVGKLVFGSGGYGFISKKDYNEHGPYVHSSPI